MRAAELKSQVEAGSYKPDPSRIALAILRRRGIRELLMSRAGAADRNPSQASLPHRAA